MVSSQGSSVPFYARTIRPATPNLPHDPII